MAKYRMLFLLISVVLWSGILYAVSKVRPNLIQEMFAEEKVIKADKDKKPPPPPPPPPPPEKLPPPPPLVERKTTVVVDVPRVQDEPRPVVERPVVIAKPTEYTAPPPEPVRCANPAFQQASGGGTISVPYDPPAGAGSGRVSAEVDVDASGRATDVNIGQRSGNSQFDSSFEGAARARRYEAALRDCNSVGGGKVTVTASFTAAPPPPPPPPSCTEAATPARITRAFNIERAYPQRAIDRGQEGAVTATLQISAAGDVVGVVIVSESPPGVFGSSVEREARRMKFAPARANCESVADTIRLPVQFKLGE